MNHNLSNKFCSNVGAPKSKNIWSNWWGELGAKGEGRGKFSVVYFLCQNVEIIIIKIQFLLFWADFMSKKKSLKL